MKHESNEKHQDALRAANPKDRQGAPQDAPIVVNMDSRPKSKDEAAEEREENNRKKLIDTGTVLAAVLAALFTGALVVVGLCGVRAANRTLLAIGKQVILMKKQERLMRDTAQKQLRAYISVSSASMNRVDHSNVPEAQIELKNFGQTPAHDVTGWIDIVFGEYPLTQELPVPDRRSGVDVLGPGQISIFAPPQKPPLPQANLSLLGSPRMTCYVYGEVRYRDVFGNEWKTQYRLLYGGVEATRHMSDTGQWLLSPDVEGNKAT